MADVLPADCLDDNEWHLPGHGLSLGCPATKSAIPSACTEEPAKGAVFQEGIHPEVNAKLGSWFPASLCHSK